MWDKTILALRRKTTIPVPFGAGMNEELVCSILLSTLP
jgi:hypothetical protein